jgi:hypothetical protein
VKVKGGTQSKSEETDPGSAQEIRENIRKE